jgi:hypothetical protein
MKVIWPRKDTPQVHLVRTFGCLSQYTRVFDIYVLSIKESLFAYNTQKYLSPRRETIFTQRGKYNTHEPRTENSKRYSWVDVEIFGNEKNNYKEK